MHSRCEFSLNGTSLDPLLSQISMASVEDGNGRKEEVKLRVFFIPFFASGHMIPMLDLARLFAARRGVEPTMVVTPANAALIRPSIARSTAAGHRINLLLYPFPSAESGLPAGVENLSTVSSADEWRIYKAVDDIVPATHDSILRDHRPDAVVADVPFWRTTATAAELGIPRITFHPVGVFPQCVMNSLSKLRPHDSVSGEQEPFTVAELPGPPVELVRSELPEFLRSRDHLTEAWDKIHKAQMECYGAVVNTFYELEPDYCDLYRRTECRAAWFVGPVAAAAGDSDRGGNVTENRDRCIAWLDARKPRSVVYVCFGSWSRFSPEQLEQLAAGLEASGQPFLWVVRGGAVEVGERGLVVNGWAPQVEILNHPAVGMFLTHCGWNSVLEAAAAGVPMLTWPLVFEQFINERLVVGLMGAGVRVWEGPRSTEESKKVVVPGEVIGRVLSGFLEGGGEKARLRAQEYKALAKAAITEDGSSRQDLNRLIDELMTIAATRERL